MNGFQQILPLFIFVIGFSLGQSSGLMKAQQTYRSPASIDSRVFHEANLQLKGKVKEVIDGDTFVLTNGRKDWTIRVSGIDSPEKSQPFGVEARDYAKTFLKDDIVEVYKPGLCKDNFNRVLGVVRSGTKKTDFGLLMIKKGLAHYNAKYQEEYDPAIALNYVDHEKSSKKDNKGLWKQDHDKIVMPWEARKIK